ncbi:LpxI family protein [Aliishimia ponticola]|uniref:LpxI family protein n=1 Tax=Aliishimia ponticola TaxID=2499833 RepID=A0A4S4NFL9_9RHOB|nr:UDP-2,3-diacylglucosamine diphosphatase LpxI [Aliishimia ponticola]THH38392.1 LpxI family protein [Aliishimia ponticola]
MLALICGRGLLPAAVATAQPQRPLVCALTGFEPETLQPDLTFRLEHLGTLLRDLTARGVSEICFCGAIERPKLDPGALDAETAPLVPRIMAAMGQGDDGALRAVAALFEEAGFTIRAAHELASDLTVPSGVLTRVAPPSGLDVDLATAQAELQRMGQADLGQACLVKGGKVLRREDETGTAAMIAAHQGGGVLFKAPKPGQDRRMDLPTIGPDTALAAVRAGLTGIAIEAGGVIVLDRRSVIDTLDDAGLFLWAYVP